MPDEVGPVAEPIKEVVEKVEPVHLSGLDKVEEIDTPVVVEASTVVGKPSVETDKKAKIAAVENVQEEDV